MADAASVAMRGRAGRKPVFENFATGTRRFFCFVLFCLICFVSASTKQRKGTLMPKVQVTALEGEYKAPVNRARKVVHLRLLAGFV